MSQSQFIRMAQLTAVYNEPRDFAGHQILFTGIADGLYLTLPQICDLLAIAPKSTRDHIDSIYAEYEQDPNSAGINMQHLIVYEVPINYLRATEIEDQHGGGGGTKLTKFYHHELVLKIVERMRNSDRKQNILNWMRTIVSQYIQQGFVLDDYALETSPAITLALEDKIRAYNFSPERKAMVMINNRIDKLFARCSGIHNTNGTINYQVWDYFRRCCHNTAHISAVGLTALQLRAARADPSILSFGQVNYRGLNAPYNSELKNACNFLSNHELMVRSGVVDNALGRVMVYIDNHGAIDYHDALKMITMHSVSQYIQHTSWDYNDYPETAIDTIVNMADKSTLRAETRAAIKEYLENFPHRHILQPDKSRSLAKAVDELVAASIQYVGNGEAG